MSARKLQWYDEYNKVGQRQKEYLERIHDLRRSLISKDNQCALVATGKQHHLQSKLNEPKYQTLRKMRKNVVQFGLQPFPQRNCLLHDRNQFYMAPESVPRNLSPLSRYKQLERKQLEKVKTEYEPFESIARRNKLDLNKYESRSSSGVSYTCKSMQGRQELAVSTVCVKTGLSTHQIESPT